MFSQLPRAQLEASFLRDAVLFQRILSSHLLDLVPVEDQTASHKFITGPPEDLDPLLALLVCVTLKVVLPLWFLEKTDRKNISIFSADLAVFQQ